MGVQWRASWIWTSDDPTLPNSYIYARRVFQVADPGQSASLHCCADSRYNLYVNGRLVGRGPARHHPSTPTYDTHLIAPYLQSGKNVIAFLVHHIGVPVLSCVPVRGGLICQVGLPGETIGTDEAWRVLRADGYVRDVVRMCPQQGFPEIHDARNAPVGWETLGLDDSGWESATVIAPANSPPWDNLEPRDIPHLFEMTVYPESIRETGMSHAPDGVDPNAPYSVAELIARSHHLGIGGEVIENRCHAIFPDESTTSIRTHAGGQGSYMVIDFAREVVGYPTLEILGQEGAVVDIGYSEVLIDGRVPCDRGGVHYADRYVLRDGWQTVQPVMPRALRFMHIAVRNAPSPLELKAAYLRFSTYPVEYYGSFECSDPVLNQVWDLGTYTTQVCMEDAYTDGPWRERAQWWRDARIEALVSYYAFGDSRLMRRGLLQSARGQAPDGLLPACYPSAVERPSPEATCLWTSSLWEYYLYTGDTEVLAELFPSALAGLAWFEGYSNELGLIADTPQVVFIDWADLDRRGAVAALNCDLLIALRDAERMAWALGRDDDAKSLNTRAEALRMAIREHLIHPDSGLIVDCLADGKQSDRTSEQANALAVIAGVFEEREVAEVADRIGRYDPSITQPGTPHASALVLRAMYRVGRHGRAADYIRHMWGRMLDTGATTCWELWAPTRSLCHGWSGEPTYHLSAEFLGVRPITPGYATFGVRPRCVDLTWMKGIVPTPHGEIDVSWLGRPDGEEFQLEVVVPEGTVGRVAIPEATPEHWQAVELDGGRVWRLGLGSAPSPHVRSVWSEPGYLVFELEPGRHSLRAYAS